MVDKARHVSGIGSVHVKSIVEPIDVSSSAVRGNEAVVHEYVAKDQNKLN